MKKYRRMMRGKNLRKYYDKKAEEIGGKKFKIKCKKHTFQHIIVVFSIILKYNFWFQK